MKTTLFATTAIVGLMTGAANADDFDNTTFETVLYSGKYEFSLSGDTDNGFNNTAVGMVLFPHEVGTLNASVYTELGYNFDDNEVSVTGEYQMFKNYDFGELYGAVAVDYVTLDDDLDSGDWGLTPHIGAVYDVTNKASVFAEVGYSWNMTQDWDATGGYTEVGVDFSVSDNVALTPSVIRTFDTANDEYQANLTLGISF